MHDLKLIDLLGRIIVFKARNVGIAQWEKGILEEVHFKHDTVGSDRVMVRMKDKQVHELDLGEFEVKSGT